MRNTTRKIKSNKGITVVGVEKWKEIDGFDGKYLISNHGNIKNSITGRILKQTDTGTSLRIGFTYNGKTNSFMVAKLVLKYFSKADETNDVLYRDGDYTNTALWNLRWLIEDMIEYTPGTMIETGPRKSIPGYNRYEITECGRIILKSYKFKSKKQWSNEVELTPSLDNAGYMRINLISDQGLRKRLSVHRLVALSWLPNPVGYDQVHHIDHNKLNNNLDNLEWVSHQMNVIAAYDAGEYKYKPISIRLWIEEVDGTVIVEHRFSSLYRTAKFLNTYPSHVSNVLHGKYGLKTIYGYNIESL